MQSRKNSNIPVPREALKPTNNNLLNRFFRKQDIPRSVKKNIPSKTSGDYFTIIPIKEDMDKRDNWPNGKARPNLEKNFHCFSIIYSNAKNIAKNYFEDKFYRVLFPPDFDSACLAYSKGDITAGKQTFGYAKKNQNCINLAYPLSELMNLINTKKSLMLNLTDFVFLYITSILCICQDEGNLKSALDVLNIFLQSHIKRLDEIKFLFSSLLITLKVTKSINIHNQAIAALARLCELDSITLERIELGNIREDTPPELAQICKEVIKYVPKEKLKYIQVFPKTLDEMQNFAQITPDYGPESAVKRLEQLKSIYQTGHFPPQPVEMLANTIETMKRLITEQPVIVSGFHCIQLLIPQCSPAPSVFGDVLALASHFPGEESAEQIYNLIFSDSLDILVIVQSVEGAISYIIDPNDIVVLMERFAVFAEPRIQSHQISEYYLHEIVNCLLMHEYAIPNYLMPFFNQDSANNFQGIEESIKSLLNPETVFEETEKIVFQGDGSIIEYYPLYLRGYLQRAFYIYRNNPAPGMSQEEQAKVQRYQEMFSQMTPEELNTGPYSFTQMSQQFKNLQEARNSLI